MSQHHEEQPYQIKIIRMDKDGRKESQDWYVGLETGNSYTASRYRHQQQRPQTPNSNGARSIGSWKWYDYGDDSKSHDWIESIYREATEETGYIQEMISWEKHTERELPHHNELPILLYATGSTQYSSSEHSDSWRRL
jgi:hypothetical protein